MLKMLQLKELILLCFLNIVLSNSATSSSSSSEVLIIRHGRSRVRHSNEKDHIRWGLKAFDNLTLDYIDNYYENDTQELSAGGNNNSNLNSNGTSSETITIKINQTIDYDTTIDNFKPYVNPKNLQSSSTSNLNSNNNNLSKTPKKKLGKKEIMENIRKTVDKGIEYLKSHPNLDEIKIEIKDLRDNHANYYDDNLLLNNNEFNNDFNFIITSTSSSTSSTTTTTTARTTTTKAPITKAITHSAVSAPTPSTSITAETTPSAIVSLSNRKDYLIHIMKSNSFVLNDTSKSSEEFQNVESAIDVFNRTLNEGEVVSGQTATHPAKNRSKDEKTKAESKNILNLSRLVSQDDVHNENENDKDIIINDIHKIITNKDNVRDDNDNNNDDDDVENDNINNTDNNPDDIMNDNNIEMNDELINLSDDTDVDDANSNIEIDIEDILNDNDIDINIHRLDDIDIDLSDLDETSKNNRKNLIRGRDVVTQFLQIVESQHLLGANCTAGTALNLGEGVVDRYAQDRFRVEAEVAVNRANMLTR